MLLGLSIRLRRHVDRNLVAYAEGELDPLDVDRVTSHLSACGRCRRQLRDVLWSVGELRELPLYTLPAQQSSRIRAEIRRELLRRRDDRRRFWARAPLGRPELAAAALVLALLGLGVLLTRSPHSSSSLRPARRVSDPVRLAAEIHRQVRAGTDDSTPERIRTDSASAAAAWIRESSALDASVVSELPPRGGARLLGAAIHPRQDDRKRHDSSASLHYRIDSRPVTLVIAASASVDRAAPWSHFDAPSGESELGATVMSWAARGQVYSLVSDEPLGTRACVVCHAGAVPDGTPPAGPAPV